MKTYIEIKDAPAWAKPLLKEHGINKELVVMTGIKHRIGGSWHDLCRLTLYGYNEETGGLKRVDGEYGGVTPFHSKTVNYLNAGFDVQLQSPSQFFLEISSYPKTARLYVHPGCVAKALPEQPVLTKEELAVLWVTKSYKANYRAEELFHWRRLRKLEIDKIKERLHKEGYLTAAGAITVKGKNAVPQINGLWELDKE